MTKIERKAEAIAIRTENEDGRTIGKAVLHMTAKQAEMFEHFPIGGEAGLFIVPVRREFDVFGKMFWVPAVKPY